MVWTAVIEYIFEESHILLGQLIEHVQRIRDIFTKDCSEHDSSESDIDFLPTPPPSDYLESRPQVIDGWLFNMNTESMHIADKSIPCCCKSGYSWCLSRT